MSQFRPDATRILASPGNLPTSLQRLARAAVPALGDFCLIFLLDGTGARCAAGAHVTRDGESLLRALNRVYRITLDDPVSTVAQVLRTGRAQLRQAIAAENQEPPRLRVLTVHQRLGCRSALVVPIGSMPRVLGALSLTYSISGRQYTPQDIAPVQRVAACIEAFLRGRGLAPPPASPGRRPIRLRARA